jgi:hypothetical protein
MYNILRRMILQDLTVPNLAYYGESSNWLSSNWLSNTLKILTVLIQLTLFLAASRDNSRQAWPTINEIELSLR